MALAADRATRVRASDAQRTGSGDVAANAVIYRGAVIAKNAGGYIVPASDTAALKVVGVSEQKVDNTGGANGALTVTYTTALEIELDNAGGAIVQAGKHVGCYVSDDASVTTAAVAANDVLAGIVMEFTATKVWVYVDEALDKSVVANPLVGTDVQTVGNAAVDPAATVCGIPEIIAIDIPNAADATYVFNNAEKIEITDAWLIKDTAGAGNTVAITDSADAAISDVMAFAVDKTITRAATLDKAKRVLAANAKFKVVVHRAAGSSAGQLFLRVIKRA